MRSRVLGKLRRKAAEKLEAKRIRVLKVWALGPSDALSIVKWMKEGSMLEELLRENIELRGRYINLEARLTMLADRIAAEKLRRIFLAARKIEREVEVRLNEKG